MTTSTTQGTSVATANSPAKTIPDNTPAKDSKKPAANTQQQMDHAQEEGSDKASELRTVPVPIVGQRRGDEDNMGMSQSLEAEERFLRGLVRINVRYRSDMLSRAGTVHMKMFH